MTAKDKIISQIDEVLRKYQEVRSRSRYEDCSDQPNTATTSAAMLMSDAIKRLAPRGSQYSDSLQDLLKTYGIENASILSHLAGALTALKVAYQADYLLSVEELVHASLFADFIEMAEYLLSEGYKDPAAVIIGSVLEEHLRQLCIKNNLSTDINGKPKKADQLNSDLAGQSVYSKLDQKSVTSWLDLRNKAAHGRYAEYTKDHVVLFVQGIQNFMTRIPA